MRRNQANLVAPAPLRTRPWPLQGGVGRTHEPGGRGALSNSCLLYTSKQVASHFGGTRNGAIVHWPNGFSAQGEVRNQFHHLIDVVPTILEAAGIPEPTFVNGIEQQPMHCLLYTSRCV